MIAGILPQIKPYKIKKIKSLFQNNNIRTIPISYEDISQSSVDFFVLAGIPNHSSSKEYIESYKNAKLSQKPILIIESPVIRLLPDLKKWTRLCFNSIFMDEGIHLFDNKINRWQKLSKEYNLPLKKWHSGNNILINLQIPTDAALNRINLSKLTYIEYMISVIKEIKAKTDRKIVLRPHPLDRSSAAIISKDFKNLEISSNLLVEDLINAKVMITYNSTSCIESIINGTPVISLDSSCIGWEVSGHSIDSIEDDLFFDRSLWLNKISYMQWHSTELTDPNVWKLIKGYL